MTSQQYIITAEQINELAIYIKALEDETFKFEAFTILMQIKLKGVAR